MRSSVRPHAALGVVSLRFLLAVTAALVVLLGALTAGGLVLLTARVEAQAVALGQSAESIRVAKELQRSILVHDVESILFVQTGDAGHYERMERAEEQMYRWTVEASHHIGTREEAALVERLQRGAHDYVTQWRQSGGAGRGPLELTPELEALRSSVYDDSERLADLNEIQAREAEAEIDRENRLAGLLATSGGVLVLVILVGLFIGARRMLYRPLLRIRDAIHDYQTGRGGARVPSGGPRELREIAAVFNRTAERLDRQRQIQLTFLAAVAHELRAPIATISNAAHLLERAGAEDEDRDRIVRGVALVRRQVRALARMVSDLLDTARVEAGHLELRVDPHDLRVLLSEILAGLPPRLEHPLEARITSEPVPVCCDAVRIEQVVMNLVSNAWKYSPEGGRVWVELDRLEDEAVLSVRDEGIGIAPDEQGLVFEPFHRAVPPGEGTPGIGLGLSVTRRIVEAHGGRVELESRPGAGSLFRVRLPMFEARH